jgi:hypothetical protein
MQTLDTISNTILLEKPGTILPKPSPGPLWLWGLVKSLVWLFISVLALLTFLELLFSIAHLGEEEGYKLDPLRGYVHLENKIFTWRVEGFSSEKINSAGFCDVERSLAKPPGTIRIAVIGDSLTEAKEVPLKNRFTSLLEARFNEIGKCRVEVLNFGSAGYSTGQEYLQYICKVAAYKPDITILCYHDRDDIQNAALSSFQPSFGIKQPDHVTVRWVEFDRYRKSEAAWKLTHLEWLRKHSRVLGVLLKAYSGISKEPLYHQLVLGLSSIANIIQQFCVHVSLAQPGEVISQEEAKINFNRLKLCREASLSMDSSTREYPPGEVDYWDNRTINMHMPDTLERWSVTRAIVRLLFNACERNKSKLVFVSLPDNYPSQSGQELLDWCVYMKGEKSIPVLNMYPLFLDAQSRPNDCYFFPSSHLTTKGHKLVAQLLYDFIQKQKLLDQI